MLVVNYKKTKEILKHNSNKKKFLQILKQCLNEEAQERNEGELTEKNILKETLLFFSKDLTSYEEIRAETFFRVLAKQALNNHDCWETPEELYKKLIK